MRDLLTRLVAPRVAGRPGVGRLLLVGSLPTGSTGAEIGVWTGDFSSRLLHAVRPAKLHLIDPWQFEESDEYSDAWYGGAVARSQADMDRVHEGVRARFATELASGVVEIHRAPSTEAAASFADGSLDWVYIDGNHLYDHVLADLQAFGAKVRPGGLITGDDFGLAGWWDDGVTKAVLDYARSGAAELELVLHQQFVLRKH
jgi:hypothetical protein